MLQKFSYKGNIFKTYEGELLLNSIMINNSMPVGSEKFFFSVEDDILGEKMLELEGQRVVLRYKQKKGILPWRGDSPYIVDSIKIVD
jgi:hypothetical protein